MYEDLRINDVPFVGPYKVINAKTKAVLHEYPEDMDMAFDLALAKVKLIYAEDGVLVIEVEG